MQARALAPALFAGIALGAWLGGCRTSRPNPEHCFFAEGDQTCAELDASLPYCVAPACSEVPYGCVAERPADNCYSPCGDGALVEEDASCVEVAQGSETSDGDATEEGSSSGGESETSESECASSEDCPEDAPYCLLGACVTCDATPEPAEACFALTGGQASICLDGACVECSPDDATACEAELLVCAAELLVCVPCSAHDQCAGGAGCDLVRGECLPPDAVWHVDGDGGADFETLADALTALGEGSGTLILHALDAPGYAEGISLSGDRALAVFGAADELPQLELTPVSLAALDGARVYARGLVLNGESGAYISGAHLELDAVRLAPVVGGALIVEGGTLRMRNSMLRSALGPEPVLSVVGTGDIDVRYSTLVGMGEGPAVGCQGATILPGARVRNSILVNLGDAPAILCASPAYEYNGLENAEGFDTNTTLGDVTFNWFVDLLLADMHLALGAPVGVADAARWSPGDPTVDVDGSPRPDVDGAPDFVGADRLP